MGSLPSSSGLAASSLAGSNAITLDGHGFVTGDPFKVRAIEGGSLSAPLIEGVTYYAIRVSNACFEVAATPGGAALDLTTNAISMVVSREPDFDYWIWAYSRWADTSLPGNLVPLGRTAPVPGAVEVIVADLVAKRMFNAGGQESESLKDMEIASVAQLKRFAGGMPLRELTAPSSANLAITTTLGSVADPRGWGSGTLP